MAERLLRTYTADRLPGEKFTVCVRRADEHPAFPGLDRPLTHTAGMAYDELTTDRLLLRAWRPQDREPFAALNADPVVMEHFPVPLTREQSDAFVARIEAHFAEHGYGLWVVEEDGEFAGFTGLSWSRGMPFADSLEVGWRLAQPFWGRGIATEAATAALAFGLQREPSVVSFTALTNVRSWRVMERIGMHRDATFDHPRLPAGHRLERHVLYRVGSPSPLCAALPRAAR